MQRTIVYQVNSMYPEVKVGWDKYCGKYLSAYESKQRAGTSVDKYNEGAVPSFNRKSREFRLR